MKSDKEPNSFGYRGGILSKREGFMEQCIDEIRSATSSLEAISILGAFVDKQIKERSQQDYNLNKQESKELAYFQKIQVLKQEVSALKLELGKANAEIAHLSHALTEKISAELLSRYGSKITKKNARVKCAKLMNELLILKGETLPPRQ